MLWQGGPYVPPVSLFKTKTKCMAVMLIVFMKPTIHQPIIMTVMLIIITQYDADIYSQHIHDIHDDIIMLTA